MSPITPFLKHVADDLYQKEGGHLGRIAVVCPNKRASLFLNEYLAAGLSGTDKPLWLPQYMTISELFARLSPELKKADTIETVCRIYRLYKKHTRSSATLDFFYGWGEKLLADFDDVDKNMADAKRLFRNLEAIKKLEETDYIDEEKEAVLRKFFADFDLGKLGKVRANFRELWDALLPIYEDLNAEMTADGLAYEGALHRRVAESLNTKSLSLPADIDKFAFVGFNVLNKAEETLFAYLRDQNKALFYWDYDLFYCPEARPGSKRETHFEAGTFLCSNLEKFPNALPATYFDNLRRSKTIEFVSAATENAQARSAEAWLKTKLTPDNKETAIVLCNEDLLQPLLHSLPANIEAPNITKGYPLHHTVAYRTVERAMSKERKETDNLTYIDNLIEQVRNEAQKISEKDGYPQKDEAHLETILATEAYFLTYQTLGRFRRLLTEGWLTVEPTTLHKLLRQVLRGQSVPFHGEPVAGLQIMGVLETRCLDFRHLLMLSVNEGNIPRRQAEDSFIPHPIRHEYGLTTARHKTAVYAYYFYRLIQRAECVRLVYNASTTSGGAGEMSRFMTQLLIESGQQVRHVAQTLTQKPPRVAPRKIPKPADLSERLKTLSPSAINTYLRCPVLFFFQRVLNIEAPQTATGIIAPNELGSVFHKAAELIYTELAAKRNKFINAAMLTPIIEENADLDAYIKRAFAEERIAENSLALSTIKRYLLELLKYDQKLGSFTLHSMEEKHGIDLDVPTAEGHVPIRVEGIIDRMDLVATEGAEGQTLRVLDYKTGGEPETAKKMSELFTPAASHPHYILQTFIYALIMCGKTDLPVKPSLFFVHKTTEKEFSPDIRFENQKLQDFRPLAQNFKEGLIKLLQDILDTTDPYFHPTKIEKHCKSCAFATLCKQ